MLGAGGDQRFILTVGRRLPGYGGRESQWILSPNSVPFPSAAGGPMTRGLFTHHLAFSSFNQISASMRRNWTS